MKERFSKTNNILEVRWIVDDKNMMDDKKKKDFFNALPVENHKTAAWIESTKNVKPNSQVIIPRIEDVEFAKEWVDSNEL